MSEANAPAAWEATAHTTTSIPPHRRIAGFDEAIVSLYAKGLTTGEIRAHLAEIYQVEVSRDLISRVTDKVVAEMEAWRHGRWTGCIRWC